MNTFGRLRKATAEPKYAKKMWSNFRASAVEPANSISSYGFWNASDSLFYRDDRFVGSRIYWGRGNGAQLCCCRCVRCFCFC